MSILISKQKLPKGFKDSKVASLKDSLQKANEKIMTSEEKQRTISLMTPTVSLRPLSGGSRSTNFLSELTFSCEETIKQLCFEIKPTEAEEILLKYHSLLDQRRN